ncbi:hypothetical protein [Rubellicoccus peritrichatus]|uniref:Uncharacterized protein n=1 Tax=Rubellicoccus peritrichatus TaxID=3080537 RepID=A0AAQ3L7B5_9BACT|nr:hypothetical protein [Puniceicoccus sp. CR14]WOO40386.1 hypothetical protein RZN69_17340 [Puniceicoccus sp. CR14]WOO40435.1 hypothetical protein RZN69_17585 [Puniceicoccus sp. CR14]WOO40484.1 hypothetical protein RZN69_17830 [Puniceicoccus sp. CR14]WOO40533.1 hypothetical protein RZN69_18075 [Puniceicoccus sp. CR14]
MIVNRTELARVLGLTTARITQLANDEVVKKLGRGKYDLSQSVQGYIALLKKSSEEKQSSDFEKAIQRERLRKVTADADIRELERDEKASVTLPVEEVEEKLEQLALGLRKVINSWADIPKERKSALANQLRMGAITEIKGSIDG